MHTPERRHATLETNQMREQLNDAQRGVLRLLEHFGWELRFVRHSPSEPVVPVICAGDTAWALIRNDGSVDERTRFEVRH